MSYRKTLIKLILFLTFIFIYQFKATADNRICQNNVTDFIDKKHNPNHYEYLETRNDAGIFFDFFYCYCMHGKV